MHSDQAMRSNQKTLKTALFLALLALAVRGKRRVAAVASLARESWAMPARAARGLIDAARSPQATAQEASRAACRAFVKAPLIWIILAFSAVTGALCAGENALTQPGKSDFVFASAHDYLIERLAPYDFLDRAADWTAQRCEGGAIGRKGSRYCRAANPPRELGDARALLADAKRVYEGRPAKAVSAELKTAAQEVAAGMIKRRNDDVVLVAMTQSLFAVELGVVVWGMFLAVMMVFKNSSFIRWAQSKGAKDAHSAMLWAVGVFGLPAFLGICAWAIIVGAGALWAAQQTPWLADRALLWEELNQPPYQMPDAKGSELLLSPFALREKKDQPGATIAIWESRPNNLGIRRADDPGARASDTSLGRWTPSQMASARAPAQLARQAPGLTAQERSAALVDLSFARDRQVDPWTIFARGATLATCLAMAAGALVGVFLALRGAVRGLVKASSEKLQALAEEGAQIPLAHRERKAMEEEMRKAESESGLAREDRSVHKARRL